MRAVVFTFVILLFLTLSPQVVQAQEQPSAAVVAVAAEQVDWEETEEGFLRAVLYGDLSNEGRYVMRLKLPANWVGRPHTHGDTEIVSVHSGTLLLAYGEDLSQEGAKSFGPGSLIVLPVGTKMRAFTGEDEVVLDIQGQGPATTQYLDEESNEGN